MKIYGLTGGIASGKTTAGEYFAELGVPVIDADDIARELRAPGGAAHAEIVRVFGTDDPAQIRARIFSDPAAKKTLEALLHPLIQAESERRFRDLALLATPPPYALYEAALLVETGRAARLDGLIVVHSTPENQLARLMKRNGLPEAEARQALVAQGDPRVKIQAATYLIQNDGSLDELRNAVLKIHSLLG